MFAKLFRLHPRELKFSKFPRGSMPPDPPSFSCLRYSSLALSRQYLYTYSQLCPTKEKNRRRPCSGVEMKIYEWPLQAFLSIYPVPAPRFRVSSRAHSFHDPPNGELAGRLPSKQRLNSTKNIFKFQQATMLHSTKDTKTNWVTPCVWLGVGIMKRNCKMLNQIHMRPGKF